MRRLICLALAGMSIWISGCSNATPDVPEILHAEMNGQQLTIPSRLLVGPPRISESHNTQQSATAVTSSQENEIAGFGLAMDPKAHKLISFSESLDLSSSAIEEKDSSINHVLIDVNFYERKDIPLSSLEKIAFYSSVNDTFHGKITDITDDGKYMAFHVKNFDPKKDHASDAYLSKSEDIYVICDKLAIYPSGVPGEASCHAMFPFPRLNANVIFSVNEHQFANIESLRRDIELQIGSFIDSRSKGN